MCESPDSINMTAIPAITSIEPTSQTILSAIDQDEPDYPFWHVIFWVSPHFQAFVVSTSIILFALPVSYFTGNFHRVKSSQLRIGNSELELIDENLIARQDDPYEKRLQIELFQSKFYPTAIRNYFKLPEDVNENDFNEMEEKQPLK